jgi:hypothetical protein
MILLSLKFHPNHLFTQRVFVKTRIIGNVVRLGGDPGLNPQLLPQL